MTFLDKLQSHKGGLIRLRTELYWYDGQDWDNSPGRTCLLLGADASPIVEPGLAFPAAAKSVSFLALHSHTSASALLLIDGQPQWIWLVDQDVELIAQKP